MKNMEEIDVYLVTKKLLGAINPAGESHTDETRLQNLKNTIEVAECLINDIIVVARHKGRHEASVNEIGTEADNFITRLRESLK